MADIPTEQTTDPQGPEELGGDQLDQATGGAARREFSSDDWAHAARIAKTHGHEAGLRIAPGAGD